MILYGIPNCDTCRKARRWLEDAGVEYRFHDLRSDGIDTARIEKWLSATDADRLLNRRGTTWRNLSEKERAGAGHPDSLLKLLEEQPTLIKRPVLEHSTGVEVGFSAARYETLLAGAD